MTSRTTVKTTSIALAVLASVYTPVSPLFIPDNSHQRAGMKGTAFTYFTTDNAKSSRELLNILREAKQDIPSQLEEMAQYGGGGGGQDSYQGGMDGGHGGYDMDGSGFNAGDNYTTPAIKEDG